MKIKSGKLFEQRFKDSIPEDVYYYRFKDGTANFGGARNVNVRFQATNKCDCEVFYNNTLYNFELKSHKGKSLPFSCIKDNQIKELLHANKFGIKCGILIEFSDLKEYYYVDIYKLAALISINDRKSISANVCNSIGIKVDYTVKISKPKFNIYKLLDDIKREDI